MRSYLRLFLFVATAGLWAAFSAPQTVHAAASTYTSNVSSATVGTSMSNPTVFTYKVGDATGWNDGETLTVALPANFPIWDSLTYTVTVGDGASTSTLTGGGVNYDDNGARLLTITEGTAPLAGTYIAVNITAGLIPTYSDSTSDIAYAGTSDETGTITINTAAAASAPTLTLAGNAVVGASSNSVFAITVPIALTTNDYIQFSVPNNLGFSSAAFVSTNFAGGGTFSSCTGSSQILTCVVSGTINAGSGTITVSGVKSLYAATSQTLVGTVADSSDNVLATASNGTVTNTTVGALTGLSIVPNTFLNEAPVQYAIAFTTTAAIPNLGKIAITFPAGVGVAGFAGNTASSLSGLDGTWTASVSGQTVTLTQSSGGATAAGAKSFVISGGTNPTALGVTGTTSVLTKYAAGSSIQTATTAAGYNVIGVSRYVAPTDTATSAPAPTPAPTASTAPAAPAPAAPTTPAPTSNTPAPAPVATPVESMPTVLPAPAAPVVEETPAAPLFAKTLKAGSGGADVVTLQTLLESKGFLKMPKGVAKGYFGALTKNSLKKYQKALKVKQTGVLDAATRAAIK